MSEEEKTEEELLLDELDELDKLYTEESEPEDSDPESDPESKPEQDSDPEAKPDLDPDLKEELKDESKEDSEKKSEKTPEEKSKEKSEDPKDSKEKSEDDRYEKLLEQINVLKGELAEKSVKDPKDETELKSEDINFLSEISLDDLGSNPEILNKVFNQILREAVKSSSQIPPQTINKQIEDSLTAHEISIQFYNDNRDLSNVRNVVKACAGQVISEHEDWNISQVLEESAKRTRESLGIPVPKAEDISDLGKASFSGGSKGSRQAVKKSSALQQELDEM